MFCRDNLYLWLLVKKKKEWIFRKYLVERIICSNLVEVEVFIYYERRVKCDKKRNIKKFMIFDLIIICIL